MTTILDRDPAAPATASASVLQPRSRQVIGGACLLLVPIGWAVRL